MTSINTTPNYNLNLPLFNESLWHDEVNDNFTNIDALIHTVIGITDIKGVYLNSTQILAGEKYFDPQTGIYYNALSDFITMPLPNLFRDERLAFPDRWEVLDSGNVGASAQLASTFADNAADSQAAALDSAQNASDSEDNAALSEAAALTSETNAGLSEAATLTYRDQTLEALTYFFKDRDTFVAAMAAPEWENPTVGTIAFANGLFYKFDGAETLLDDLPGFTIVENDDATIEHFANNIINAEQYCFDNGKTLVINQYTSVAANITMRCKVKFIQGASIDPDVGVLIEFNEQVIADRFFIFDLTSGDIKLRCSQIVYPEWFADNIFNVQNAFKKSAPGSTVKCLGKLYIMAEIVINNDPLDPDSDSGKTIEGMVPAQRYQTTGEFYGTILQLAPNRNTSMITVNSGGSNTWASGGLKNVMLYGDASNQTGTSDGILIEAVKDWMMHNVYVWGFKSHGINLNGANNQINFFGFIESWNNSLDGIRAGAFGDAQVTAKFNCVNNGRHGFAMFAGSGRINQIYCYSNTERGVWFASTVVNHIVVDYIRTEDNGKEGIRIDCQNAHFKHIIASDNGLTSVSTLERSGIYLSSAAENVVIDYAGSGLRSGGGIIHNQINLIYDESGEGCEIKSVKNNAFGAYGIVGERTCVFTNNTLLSGVRVGSRMYKSDTYANLKEAGPVVIIKPDTYDRYEISAINENFTLNSTAGSTSCEDMVIKVVLNSTGLFNLNFGADYVDNRGHSLKATQMVVGVPVELMFRQFRGKWVLISSTPNVKPHMVISDGQVAGTNSAGEGNQYVRIEVNGVIYKVLHDGII